MKNQTTAFIIFFLCYQVQDIHASVYAKRCQHFSSYATSIAEPNNIKETKLALSRLYTVKSDYLAQQKGMLSKKQCFLSDKTPFLTEKRKKLERILHQIRTKTQFLPLSLRMRVLPNKGKEWNIFPVLQELLSFHKGAKGDIYKVTIQNGWENWQIVGISLTLVRHISENQGVIQKLYAEEVVPEFKQLVGDYATYLPPNPLYHGLNTAKTYMVCAHQARESLTSHPYHKHIPLPIIQLIYLYFYDEDYALQSAYRKMGRVDRETVNYLKLKYPNEMSCYMQLIDFPPCLYREMKKISHWQRTPDNLRDEIYYIYGAKFYDIVYFFQSKGYKTLKEALEDEWGFLLKKMFTHLKFILNKYLIANQSSANDSGEHLYQVNQYLIKTSGTINRKILIESEPEGTESSTSSSYDVPAFSRK